MHLRYFRFLLANLHPWLRKPLRFVVVLPPGSQQGGSAEPLSSQKTQVMRDQNYQQDLVDKVTMYLDNELSENAERELLREIQSNPAYIRVLSQEKSFREFIKNKIHRRKPSPALIQSIKEKIRITPA